MNGNGGFNANRIGQLHVAFLHDAGRHEVFGDVSGCVGRAAIHFARVFAGEGAATVRTASAVGIDHNFSSCKACIAMWTADEKAARGVDNIGGLLDFDPIAQYGCQHMVNHRRLQFRLTDLLAVLGGHDHCIDRNWPVFIVRDRHLRFGIGTQPREGVVFAQLLEFLNDLVRQGDGQRHQFGGVVAGMSEHNPLIPGTAIDHAIEDFWALGVDDVANFCGVVIESHCIIVVTDAL